MTHLPFMPDQKLTDVLREKVFTYSAEIIPPRNGTEQGKVLEQIQILIQSGAEFLAVTKGAGGSLRGGSLPIAQVIKERFKVPCIAHFTCRDLTPQEVENQLIDHHYFGIRNILALRGDPPDGQPEWKAREGGYNFAHELITQIRELNQGKYLQRPGGLSVPLQETTEFCIGAAAYPEFPDPKNRVEFFRLKVERGAHFGLTDMLFDPETYARFRDDCHRAGVRVPILPGTRVLKCQPQARRMMQKFKVNIPATTLKMLPEEDSPQSLSQGLEIFVKMTERLRQLGAPGIHLYVISDTLGASEALKRIQE
jgi:methylenetetrahydrofolate reductase (NADPH)